MDLDAFDRRILDLVQTDASQTHAEIGEKIGLSGSAVRRRIAALKKNGVIEKEVAILGAAKGVAGITLIVTVAFEKETPATDKEFRAAMRKDPRVLQCYATSGQFDFVLVVAAASPAEYESWAERALMSNKSIRRSDSFVVWSTVKFETKRLIPTD